MRESVSPTGNKTFSVCDVAARLAPVPFGRVVAQGEPEPTEEHEMTPTETLAILKQLDGWPVQHHSTKKVQEAIQAAVEMIERMEWNLRLIAETDPIDAALDPRRAVRVAKAALEELK